MRDELSKDPTHHLEQSKARIQADNSDRRKLLERLDHYIVPLHPTRHYSTMFNIVSGKLTGASVNVQNALQISKAFFVAYEDKLPKVYMINK